MYEWFYFDQRSRRKIYQNIYHKGCFESSKINFQLKKPKVAIVDVFIDEEFNLLCLAVIAGSPHVMLSSLYTTGCSRMIHRFGEYLEPLTCISSGYSLVALGSKYGKIYVYQNIPTTNCVRITAILAHHSSVVHKIIFYKDQIISCSDDMTIGIVDILPDGALILSKILQVSKGKIFLKMKKKFISKLLLFSGPCF